MKYRDYARRLAIAPPKATRPRGTRSRNIVGPSIKAGRQAARPGDARGFERNRRFSLVEHRPAYNSAHASIRYPGRLLPEYRPDLSSLPSRNSDARVGRRTVCSAFQHGTHDLDQTLV